MSDLTVNSNFGSISLSGTFAHFNGTSTSYINGSSIRAITVTANGQVSKITGASRTLEVLTNSGTISYYSPSSIISVSGISNFTNSGLIEQRSSGAILNTTQGLGTLTNSGTITSGGGGLAIGGTLDKLVNNSGGTIAADIGTAIEVGGSLGTLTNSGTIIDRYNLAIDVTGSANIFNALFGVITGDIVVGAGSTIENAGTIFTNSNGISLGFGSTLIIDPFSSISGDVSASSGTLVLNGSYMFDLTGVGSQYVGFTTLEFDNSVATLEGDADGLASGQTITGMQTGDSIVLDNFVATSSIYNSTADQLVLLDANSNTETLNITGIGTSQNFALSTDGTNTTLTLFGSVTISGSVGRQNVTNDYVDVTSSGTVSANGGSALHSYGDILGLTNAGVISPSGGTAIEAEGTIDALTNSGTISVPGGIEIFAGSIGTLTNSAVISGGAYSIIVNSNANITNEAGATISSSYQAITSYGFTNNGYATDTIENAGTISSNHTAVYFDSPNSTLIIDPTSSITGRVMAVHGGTLTLNGTSMLDLTGVGSQYVGFSTLNFANSQATLEGNANGLASGQTITGMQSGDAIVLDNFVATSETYNSSTGTLILTDANSNTETLDFNSSGVPQHFLLSNDGTNSTLTLAPTLVISNPVNGTQNVTNEYVDVTSSGTVVATGDELALYSTGDILGITNAGIISASLSTISAAGTIDALTNSGTIIGKAAAIYVGSIGTLTNSDVISGAFYGIDVSGNANITNEAGATIAGHFDAIVIKGSATIENAGTLSCNLGTAVLLDGPSTLIIDPTSSITGSVLAAAGSTLTLNGTSMLDLTGVGSQYVGFTTLHFANSQATLEGDANGLANGQTITGMQLGDKIVLDGFAATSETYNSNTGTLILTDANSNTETLDVNTSGVPPHFLLSNDGTNSTLTLAPTLVISGPVYPPLNVTNEYVDVTSSGTVYPSGTSDLYSSGDILGITNAGIISAYFYGISAVGNTIDALSNSGTIIAESFTAIDAGAIGTLTNSALISGDIYGIYVRGNANITNDAGATITAGDGNAIFIYGSATIENAGTLSSSSGTAVLLAGPSTLIIDPTSSITGSVIANAGGTLTLNGSSALDLTGVGTQYAGFTTLNFANSQATLEGDADGLASGQTITGMVTGDSLVLDGFAATSETYNSSTGTLILTDANSNTETLDFNSSGVPQHFLLSNDGTNSTLTLAPTLVISNPVNAPQDVTNEYVDVTSNGTVHLGGSALYSTSDILGITNAGYIGATSADAIYAPGAIDSLTNSGTISAQVGVAVLAGSIGTLTNSGLISAFGDGIDVSGNANITNEAGATISGSFYAITSSGNDTIENAGTLSSNLGTAVLLYGPSTLIIDPTSTIIGAVIANAGGTLTLNGTSTLDLTGVGSQYVGFTTLNFANSQATLEGDADGLASGQTITGMQTGDSLVLDGFVATSETYDSSNDQLTLTNASGQTETLDITGIGMNQRFGLTSDGSNTTLTLGGSVTISGHVNGTQHVTNDYVDVTSTGTDSGTSGPALYSSGNILGITNTGIISASFNTAVYAAGSIDALTNSGTISAAGCQAIIAGSIGTLTNYGIIQSSDSLAINVSGSANITNEAQGTIEGEISLGSGSTLENAGTITTNSSGISLDTDSTLIIDPTSSITGSVQATAGDTLTLNGTTTLDLTGVGTQYTGFTTLNFANSQATLEGDADGLAGGQTITGMQSGDSIVLDGFAATSETYNSSSGKLTLTNASGQTETLVITGVGTTQRFGLSSDGTNSTLTLAPTLVINGQVNATKSVANEYVDVTSTGTVDTGGNGAGLFSAGDIFGITNAGNISATSAAISAVGTIDALTNSGTISALGSGPAILAGSIGTLTNSDVISGVGYGIYVSGNANITNDAGATIAAGDGNAILIDGSATIENAGTLSSTSGTAVLLEGPSTLIIDPTSSITGSVLAAADSTLTLNGTIALDLKGIGTQYTGFTTLNFANSHATLEGDANGLANGQTITGMQLGDKIVLDGFAATSETYTSSTGTLILTDANSNTETLDVNTSGVPPHFLLNSDGTNSTLTLAPTLVISSRVNASENVTNGYVDVTSSGSDPCTSGPALYSSGDILGITNAGAISAIYYVISAVGTIDALTNSGIINDDGYGAAIAAGSIGTLKNFGTIVNYFALLNASCRAINVGGSANLTNEAGGTITGGISLGSGSTFENAGTITTYTGSISLGSGSTLIIDPGSSISGNVSATSGTLVLNGSLGVNGVGSTYEGFTTLKFANSNATLEGNANGLASGQTITGMQTGDSLVLDGFAAISESYDSATDQLVLTDANSNTETLDITGVGSNPDFALSTDGTNTTLHPLCFLRGTKIRTPEGQIPVEQLQPGDLVCTLTGPLRPITWIGTGRVMVPAGHRSPATPVLIRQGALGPNTPSEDLRVTKGHAIYQNNVLIPAEFLINHRSILWDDAAREVEYYHIELSTHDVILANNAPAETYRDEGNRWMFHNANPLWDVRDVAPYAPVLTGGPEVDQVWKNLLALSGENLNPPTTTEPDIHLLADGSRINGTWLSRDILSFTLPAPAHTLHIASRAAAQDVLGRFRDPRTLGIALTRITLWHDTTPTIIDADHPGLTAGFHAYEPDQGCIWTNGRAQIPPQATAPTKLHLHIAHTTHYPLQPAQEKVA